MVVVVRSATSAAAIKECNPMHYPNIRVMLQLACSLHATSCECERRASTMCHLNTYIRRIMTQKILSLLALLHIYYDVLIDLDTAIDIYSRLHPRLWEVGNVRNELVRGETGWSSFAEREVKCIVDWLLRIVYEESLVSDIGRACLMEVGYKSRWWARCNHVCDKFGLWELVNLLWLKNINKEGRAMLGMKYDRNVWKMTLVARIQEDGRRQWRNGFGINEREQQYVHEMIRN